MDENEQWPKRQAKNYIFLSDQPWLGFDIETLFYASFAALLLGVMLYNWII